MAKKTDYSTWSKEDLIKRIQQLEKRKKYGLVWDEERVPEEVVERCKRELPVLVGVPELDITTDPTQPTHILIEGDNYHALSVLNYTHEKAVDVIYIDPPYNLGNSDFMYNDRYIDTEDPYRHSKWLSFMKARMQLSRDVMKESGVIFISIDDNEQARLRLVCDEIFVEENFIANVIWQKKFSPQNDAKYFSDNHDFIIVFVRKKNNGNGDNGWKINLLPRTESMDARYNNPDNDPRGPWASGDLSVKTYTPSTDYPITTPSGRVVNPPRGYCWRVSREKLKEMIVDNRIWFGEKGNNVPRIKRFLSEVQSGLVPLTIWQYNEVGHNQEAKQELKEIVTGSDRVFESPKPVRLLTRVIQVGGAEDGVVLDFMAGSGTTGHAVLELNKSDGGSRRFILCTNNENNICTEVCYPRISKVMQGYTNAKGIDVEGLGGNLKYFRTDFVPAEPTDENRMKLTLASVEMLCLREHTFQFVEEGRDWKHFRSPDKDTFILFDQRKLSLVRRRLDKIHGAVAVYVFTLGDDDFADEFEEFGGRVQVRPIPEAIMRVYRRIFR